MDDGYPRHDRGIVAEEPGLYFVGLKFLYAASSAALHGVGRDAARVVDHLATRAGAREPGVDRPGSPRDLGGRFSRAGS
jgi:putative flavoprotein involved in K+ transport